MTCNRWMRVRVIRVRKSCFQAPSSSENEVYVLEISTPERRQSSVHTNLQSSLAYSDQDFVTIPRYLNSAATLGFAQFSAERAAKIFGIGESLSEDESDSAGDILQLAFDRLDGKGLMLARKRTTSEALWSNKEPRRA